MHCKISVKHNLYSMIDETTKILSDSWDGRKRWLYKVTCSCGNDFYAPKNQIEKGAAKYCSRDCFNVAHKAKTVNVKCCWCNKEVIKSPGKLQSKHGKYFCNRKCKEAAQSLEGGLKEIQPSHYGAGGSSYRERAFKKYGAVCCKCHYDEKRKMLDVDHVDSDRSNNDISNLQVLCVWCHAEKTRANWPDE